MIVTQLALWDVASPGRLENISEEIEVYEYGVIYGKGKTEHQKWKLEKVLYTMYEFTFSFFSEILYLWHIVNLEVNYN